jgi:hypothetical protein
MKVDEDCSHEMFVTAPLPIFTDSSVIEDRSIAIGESAFKCYEEPGAQQERDTESQCIAYHHYQYHHYQYGVLGVTWLL